MIDFVVGAIAVVIVGLALAYIIKSKKNGIKCIGCPDGSRCASHQSVEGSVSACGGCDGGACAGCSSCHTDIK